MTDERRTVRMWAEFEIEITDPVAAKLVAGIEGRDVDGNEMLMDWTDDAQSSRPSLWQ